MSASGLPPPLQEATLYIQVKDRMLFRPEVPVYNSPGHSFGRKDPKKRRPGKRCRRKTVREDSINKANNSFRTELPDTIFGKHKIISLVRRKILFFINVVARTISLPAFQPRASLHLPWARLSSPFRPFSCLVSIIYFSKRLCIKSSFLKRGKASQVRRVSQDISRMKVRHLFILINLRT